ncbi:type I-E CRISPR-associated protein Cse2/CasB [Lactiplantibacillus carotarum]|uniref:type I-E CRISPR-associated protein Cse2/CasB n=1 Tax=Lactiplantibacillus carotarum TaxID=2993456 RepID=UPI00298EDB64|nr:type I-E CRISPR-associated protein Cse2/CasB [Lactiplantibacillus carotarum]
MDFQVRTTTAHLLHLLSPESHPDKAILASLRSGKSLTSPRSQSVWPLMMENLDESMLSLDGEPTPAERAIYAAMRFYAIQQQGVQGPISEEDPKRNYLFFKL